VTGDQRPDRDCFLRLDQDRRITALSDEAAAWFGGPPEPLIGKDARKLLPFLSPSFSAIESCFATGRSAQAQFYSDFHPGYLVDVTAYPDGAGVRIGWVARSYRPGHPALPPDRRACKDPCEFSLDPDWRVTSITKSAAAWAGGAVDDLVGSNGREINPAATKLLGPAIDAALKRGATTTLTQPSSHVPGRWVRIEVEPCRNGARIRFEDVTSDVPAEPASGPEHEVGANSADEGPAEIALLDGQGVIVAANAAWRSSIVALGLKLADAGIGARYATVAEAAVPTMDVASFQRRLDDVFSGRAAAPFEATYSRDLPAGMEPRQVRIVPIRIGQAPHFLAIHEDLTQRAKVLATLAETSDQLLHAQETERQRIAIELHDSMGQHLAGLMLGLGGLSRTLGPGHAPAQARIDEMTKLTQQAIREMQVLSFLMNAAELEGLEASVRRLVIGFGRRSGLNASVAVEGLVDAVSAAAQHAVFRVIQEALSNVHRHALATRVSVKLVKRREMLTAHISDNGQGIRLGTGADPVEAPLGVGIVGMRARIEQLGGKLEIERRQSGGTRISASIPLPSGRSTTG
jgi:signal transduction histidine kinase